MPNAADNTEDALAPQGRHPRNPHGSDFALVAERHGQLPTGELWLLAWLLGSRRGGALLRWTAQELGRATCFCSKTLHAHVASLRAKGLVDPDLLRATPSALAKRGERHARIMVRDLLRIGSPADFRAHFAVRLCTDSGGRLRSTRRYLAMLIRRSRRTLRTRLRRLEAAGIPTPARLYAGAEKTFRSGWKKPSANQYRGNQKRGLSEKAARIRGSLGRGMPSGDATAAECEEARQRLKRQAAMLGATC